MNIMLSSIIKMAQIFDVLITDYGYSIHVFSSALYIYIYSSMHAIPFLYSIYQLSTNNIIVYYM